jgi:hypothetical protein
MVVFGVAGIDLERRVSAIYFKTNTYTFLHLTMSNAPVSDKEQGHLRGIQQNGGTFDLYNDTKMMLQGKRSLEQVGMRFSLCCQDLDHP